MGHQYWEALARRVVAATGGLWATGVQVVHPAMGTLRIVEVDGDCISFVHSYDVEETRRAYTDRGGDLFMPDLQDTATFGCLEAEVAKRAGVTVWLEPNVQGGEIQSWRVMCLLLGDAFQVAEGPTKAEALVRALESRDD